MISNDNRGFQCIDNIDELTLYGEHTSSDYQRLDIMILPCNYVH